MFFSDDGVYVGVGMITGSVAVYIAFSLQVNSLCIVSGPGIRGCDGKIFFLFLNQNTYVVGTQKNRLIETVLLSTQSKCLN